jgi:YidC/Oxa1 family membrane protein insertase
MKQSHLLLLIAVLPLLTGCFGAQGVPLSQERLRQLRYEQLPEIDRLETEDDIQAHLASLETGLAPIADSKDRQFRAKAARMRLLIGYCRERLGHLDEAIDWYQEAAGGQYGSVAYIRIAQVAEHCAEQRTGKGRESWQKQAIRALERAANYPIQIDPETGEKRGPLVLVRRPAVGPAEDVEWLPVDVRHYAYRELDQYYKEKLSYRIFNSLVRFCGGEDRNYSYLLAIGLIAVLAKLITTPLSGAQFRSMQAMQALQPEIKKLQEKHKGDKQQMARAQMELFKTHKINPASSCLPMLIQMPILIWVYYGIRHFVFRFEGVRFLYLDSLANPDVISIANMLWPGPLLLIYGLSMYFSQKLIATPAATPEQQQQQKLMAFMMPVLLVLILKGLPAAFILYWLLQNILMTGHQYLIMRRRRLAQVTPGAPPSPSEPRPAPPPEALDKVSQGTRPRKKKKKRR